jgi:hypothetical protein
MLLCPFVLLAQAPMGKVRRINASDLEVLEARKIRKDLACKVTPNKPEKSRSVSIPLNELSGHENQLTILFSVIPYLSKDKPSYFIQHIHVPEIDDDAKGDVNLRRMVDLGEGSYHVDWLMRDRRERVCSFYWDTEASLPLLRNSPAQRSLARSEGPEFLAVPGAEPALCGPKDKQIELALAPGTVEPAAREQFAEDPPVERAQISPPLNIKILE